MENLHGGVLDGSVNRVGNRYEDGGAWRPRCDKIDCGVWMRPSGTEAPGARRCGQTDPYDEL